MAVDRFVCRPPQGLQGSKARGLQQAESIEVLACGQEGCALSAYPTPRGFSLGEPGLRRWGSAGSAQADPEETWAQEADVWSGVVSWGGRSGSRISRVRVFAWIMRFTVGGGIQKAWVTRPS